MTKTARQKIVDKLDKIVSKIIRERDGACVVCGSTKALGWGHVFSKVAYNTRWDVLPDGNVHTQCWPCNFRHVRDQYPYFSWYIRKFGQDKFDELRRRFKTTKKYKTYELEELYEKFKDYEPTLTVSSTTSGKIVKGPTPEEVRISQERVVDRSLEGVLKKHEEKE